MVQCVWFLVLVFVAFRFVDRRDFEYIEMDTDSAYMAMSNSLLLVVCAELRRQFWLEYGDWFPRPYCDQHKTDFVNTKLGEYEGVSRGLLLSVVRLFCTTTEGHPACLK